jgi:hypothetical protein
VLGRKYENLLRKLVAGDTPAEDRAFSVGEASPDLLGDAVAEALRAANPTWGSRR